MERGTVAGWVDSRSRFRCARYSGCRSRGRRKKKKKANKRIRPLRGRRQMTVEALFGERLRASGEVEEGSASKMENSGERTGRGTREESHSRNDGSSRESCQNTRSGIDAISPVRAGIILPRSAARFWKGSPSRHRGPRKELVPRLAKSQPRVRTRGHLRFLSLRRCFCAASCLYTSPALLFFPLNLEGREERRCCPHLRASKSCLAKRAA